MTLVKAVISFGLLLSMLNGVKSKSGCNYYQQMEPGKTYYAYNPNYPKDDTGENHCKWQTTSPFNIKVNCSIDISPSVDCIKDYVSIKFEKDDKENKYCGKGNFNNEGKNVIIKFDTTSNTGGKFLCELITEKSFDEYNCQCGWKNPTKIVGGEETGINEFPMMAGIVDKGLKEVMCGASIISEQYVITAAHCIKDRNVTDEYGVLVGEHDVTTGKETNATRLYRIKNCNIHPKYNNITLDNDIAVCEINNTIQYSAKVGPVCLPFQHNCDSFGGDIMTALGWGLNEFGGAKATKLQKVDLNVLNPVECKNKSSLNTSLKLCTYTSEKDTCQMDSGGPLLWFNPTSEHYVLAGITIGGIGCASDKPGLYTRVGAYIEWIKSVTPGAQYCKTE